MHYIICIINYFYFKIKVFLDRVLRVRALKEKRLTKNIPEKFISNRRRHCSNVSRLRIDKGGEFEECGSQGMEHLNKRKRKNFS